MFGSSAGICRRPGLDAAGRVRQSSSLVIEEGRGGAAVGNIPSVAAIEPAEGQIDLIARRIAHDPVDDVQPSQLLIGLAVQGFGVGPVVVEHGGQRAGSPEAVLRSCALKVGAREPAVIGTL